MPPLLSSVTLDETPTSLNLSFLFRKVGINEGCREKVQAEPLAGCLDQVKTQEV